LILAAAQGSSGVELRAQGFDVVDGMDPSAEMLEGARAKGVYRHVTQIEPGAALPTGYAAIAAVGVIGCGAAPISVFDDVMTALDQGGLFALSFNDHALAVPEYFGKLKAYLDTGRADLVSEDYGPHLPGVEGNTGSKVYVLRKL
jgi:predicted TPR repeat methyltransferase